jgi:uncharacterized membrane protein YqjE
MSTAMHSNRSLPEIVKDLSADLGQLVHNEIALAKSEIQENVARLGTGAGLLGGAGVAGLFALEFVFLAIMFGLVALGLQTWLAALIVAVVLGAVAAVMAMRGKSKVANATVVPAATIANVKKDVTLIKHDVAEMRSRR